MSKKDSLGDRIKGYEQVFNQILPSRLPIILRLDGRSFHSYTKSCARPFDDKLMAAMDQVAIELCSEIQGAQIAYVQSDEINILIHNYKTIHTQAWFDNKLNKCISISAAIVSAKMTEESIKIFGKIKLAHFDSRIFVVPESDVCNTFIWRQKDWERNSLQMLARSHYSHSELNKKKSKDLHELLHQKNINWNDLDVKYKRGRCIIKENYTSNNKVQRMRWVVDNNIPIFSQDRNYLEKYLATEEDKKEEVK